jgi:hypothetical protein
MNRKGFTFGLIIFFSYSTLCSNKNEKKSDTIPLTSCQSLVTLEKSKTVVPVAKKPTKKQLQQLRPSKYRPMQEKNEKLQPQNSPDTIPKKQNKAVRTDPIPTAATIKKTEIAQSHTVTKELKKPAPHRPSKYKPMPEKKEKKLPSSSPDSAAQKSTTSGKEKAPTDTAKKTEITQSRTITLKNALTKEMITYSHWSGDHTPEFKITANGKEIKPETAEKIEIKNNKADVSYHYNFANGYYKGSKKVELEIPQGSAFAFDFSWKKQPNLSILPLERKEVPPVKDSTPSNSNVKISTLLKE